MHCGYVVHYHFWTPFPVILYLACSVLLCFLSCWCTTVGVYLYWLPMQSNFCCYGRSIFAVLAPMLFFSFVCFVVFPDVSGVSFSFVITSMRFCSASWFLRSFFIVHGPMTMLHSPLWPVGCIHFAPFYLMLLLHQWPLTTFATLFLWFCWCNLVFILLHYCISFLQCMQLQRTFGLCSMFCGCPWAPFSHDVLWKPIRLVHLVNDMDHNVIIGHRYIPFW